MVNFVFVSFYTSLKKHFWNNCFKTNHFWSDYASWMYWTTYTVYCIIAKSPKKKRNYNFKVLLLFIQKQQYTVYCDIQHEGKSQGMISDLNIFWTVKHVPPLSLLPHPHPLPPILPLPMGTCTNDSWWWLAKQTMRYTVQCTVLWA